MIRRFNRFELKYLVPISIWEKLVAEVRQQMAPDPMGKDGVYPIRSLYFDTADRQFYRSKIEGIKYRRKVRIRYYGEPSTDPSAMAMVEIKQRINRTTQKRRVPAKLEDALKLCHGEEELICEDPQDRAVASEVSYLAQALRLEPVCTIGYIRRAFVGGEYETGLRLTFDHLLWVSSPSGLTEEVTRYAILRPEVAVVEVKANDAVPLWVNRMLARHQVTLDRFSKYCAGVARMREVLNG